MTSSYTNTNIEEAPKQSMVSRGESRSCRPDSDAFHEFMGSGWGPRTTKEVERCDVADYLPQHAAKAGEPFAGEHLVTPAGTYKTRSNDCTYRFRAYNAFTHLSGLGGECEPDSVLTLESEENGSHEAVLCLKLCTSRSAQEFYSDPQHGESWIGAHSPLEEAYQEMGLRCAHIDTLPGAFIKDAGRVKLRIVRGVDTSIEAMVSEIREQAELPSGEGARSAGKASEERLSEIRLCRGTLELAELARTAEVTYAGFEDTMRALPRIVGHHYGEHVVEGAFGAAAHEEGDGLDYDMIAASDNHMNTLHRIDNNGLVDEGDLILVDVGAEANSLYTTDITHTLPASGHFTEAQTHVYQMVLDACEATLTRVNKPGTRFRDIHDAVMFVIAMHLREWGLLPIGVGEPLSPADRQYHRWTPRDTNHYLGFDVCDYARVCRGMYQDVPLEPGATFTIESDLHLRVDDEVIPAKHRSIGVCIEDDAVMNENGSITRISEDIPCTIDDVEAWIARTQERRAL